MRLVRIILSITLVSLYFELNNTLQVILANKMAMKQMTNTDTSFIAYRFYNSLQGYLWLIPIIIVFLIMLPEVKLILKKIKGGRF